jgi:hypothetical protein
MELASTRCRKCKGLIDVRSEEDALDHFGSFFRLRCTAAECGHVDWYKGISVVPPANAPAAPQNGGEVWVHDVILGLSFKADGHFDSDIR